jgi:hypothetical protein
MFTRCRKEISMSDKTDMRIKISGGQLGVLNIGQIDNLSMHLINVAEAGHSRVAQGLKAIVEALVRNTEFSTVQKEEVLDQLEELTRQASLPAEQRARKGVIKTLLNSLTTTLGAAGNMAEVWGTWGDVIKEFFGLK